MASHGCATKLQKPHEVGPYVSPRALSYHPDFFDCLDCSCFWTSDGCQYPPGDSVCHPTADHLQDAGLFAEGAGPCDPAGGEGTACRTVFTDAADRAGIADDAAVHWAALRFEHRAAGAGGPCRPRKPDLQADQGSSEELARGRRSYLAGRELHHNRLFCGARREMEQQQSILGAPPFRRKRDPVEPYLRD